jgi:hypothetical protein
VPAEIVAKIPENITFDQAASVPLGLATAAIGFYDALDKGGAGLTPPWEAAGAGKYKGRGTLILGGSSSVGQYGSSTVLVDYGSHPHLTGYIAVSHPTRPHLRFLSNCNHCIPPQHRLAQVARSDTRHRSQGRRCIRSAQSPHDSPQHRIRHHRGRHHPTAGMECPRAEGTIDPRAPSEFEHQEWGGR